VRRVAVIGCIGAGKSTLARRLGARLGLPVIHLDRLWWDDSAYRITGADTVAAHTMPADAFRQLQRELADGDTWVIDGGYVTDLDTRLPRADTVVFLDLPRHVCLWRLARRQGHRRPDHPDDVREGVTWLLLLARWIYRYPGQKRPVIEQAINEHCAPGATVIRLRRRRDVEAFLESVHHGDDVHLPDRLRAPLPVVDEPEPAGTLGRDHRAAVDAPSSSPARPALPRARPLPVLGEA
jgi:adenylate kinase family enzyme